MGRYGCVEEIAATIAFLASEGAGYITGQNNSRRRWPDARGMTGMTVPGMSVPPAKCPELKPQENVWQFMRDNWPP